MKIVIKKRQQTGEYWQTIFEYKDDELAENNKILVDFLKNEKKKVKGFLGEKIELNSNDNVKFGFTVLSKKAKSFELEVFGEYLFKTKSNKLTPCKIKLTKNKEILFYAYEGDSRVVYILTLVEDNVVFENIKQHNETALTEEQFKEFVKEQDKKLEEERQKGHTTFKVCLIIGFVLMLALSICFAFLIKNVIVKMLASSFGGDVYSLAFLILGEIVFITFTILCLVFLVKYSKETKKK